MLHPLVALCVCECGTNMLDAHMPLLKTIDFSQFFFKCSIKRKGVQERSFMIAAVQSIRSEETADRQTNRQKDVVNVISRNFFAFFIHSYKMLCLWNSPINSLLYEWLWLLLLLFANGKWVLTTSILPNKNINK